MNLSHPNLESNRLSAESRTTVAAERWGARTASPLSEDHDEAKSVQLSCLAEALLFPIAPEVAAADLKADLKPDGELGGLSPVILSLFSSS